MVIHLKPEQEAFIQHRVRAGAYATPDEAVQMAVALLERQEASAATAPPIPRKSLAQLFVESPFQGIDLEFTRDESLLRDIDL